MTSLSASSMAVPDPPLSPSSELLAVHEARRDRLYTTPQPMFGPDDSDDDDDFTKDIKTEMLSDDEVEDDGVTGKGNAQAPVVDDDDDARSIFSVNTLTLDPYDEADLSDDDLEDAKARVDQGVSQMSETQLKAWTQTRCEDNYKSGKPKHFECLYDDEECQTLQEYYPTRITGRSFISSIFGHNKNQWLQVPKSVRVFVCRKHYQTSMHKYRLDPVGLMRTQLRLAMMQVDKIEQWRPDCHFDIQLTSSMTKRLGDYYQLLYEGQSAEQAAANIDALPQKSKRRGIEEDTPTKFALTLNDRFKGRGKTTDDVRSLFDWIQSKADDGTIKQFPACEVLLELRFQDRIRLEQNKHRRNEAEKKCLEITGVAKRKRPSRKGLTAASAIKVESSEVSAVAGPSKQPTSEVSSSRMPPPDTNLQFINTTVASESEPTTTEPSEATSSNTPYERSGIKLRLFKSKNKGKAPIRPTTETDNVQSIQVAKRKTIDTPVLSDNDGQDSNSAFKKQKTQHVSTNDAENDGDAKFDRPFDDDMKFVHPFDTKDTEMTDSKEDGETETPLNLSEVKTVFDLDPSE